MQIKSTFVRLTVKKTAFLQLNSANDDGPSLVNDLHLCARITLCYNVCETLRLSLLLLLNNRMWELLSIITAVIIFILQGFYAHKHVKCIAFFIHTYISRVALSLKRKPSTMYFLFVCVYVRCTLHTSTLCGIK